jgi:hypothetical protein
MAKKTSAQLNREITEVLHKDAPCKKCTGVAHSSKKTGNGSTKKTKKVDGYDVTIVDSKIPGNSTRFAATYDMLPASVYGQGATAAAAIKALKEAAAVQGKRRRIEIEDEDWAQHEADKEDALARGDY